MWTPEPRRTDNNTFLIDSNGLELLEKAVITSDSTPYARYLYPVTSTIALKSQASKMAFIVKNDRPQAGTVRQNQTDNKTCSISLLIDRRMTTHDIYGIPTAPFKNSQNLVLTFKITTQLENHVHNF